ncbi:MAG: glycosyltransferase [Rhizobiales bacterium]|nr:glycosyltransferase [Hyphomicrobiales bacterium]
MSTPQFSIVIPARNEAESLADVVNEIATVLAGQSFEIVVVDDGSTDNTGAVLRMLAGQHANLRHVAHRESCGKSAAILTGVRMAHADMICTLDGDGQNDPRAIMPLLSLASEEGVALAAGQRVKHAHSSLKRIGSKFANGLRSRMLRDNTRDTACGLKALRKDVFLQLPYFDTMHRFLPALVLREGFEVRHLDVIDRPRRHGESKYGVLDRALTGALDLIGVRWLVGRRKSVPQSTEVPAKRP